MEGRSLLNPFVFLLSFQCLLAAKWSGDRTRPGDEHAEAFHAFMRAHGRTYPLGSREYRQRSALFALRRYEVELHNSDPDRLWTAGLNALSDRTDAELAQLRGWRGGALPGGASGLLQRAGSAGSRLSRREAPKRALPKEFLDWTRLKSSTHIRNQGPCGSCWAVASATVLAQHYEIVHRGSHRSFSAQELISCTPNPLKCGGTGGCGGATVELAYEWARTHGVSEEAQTPYKGTDKIPVSACAPEGGLLQLSGHGHGHGHNEEILDVFTPDKEQVAPKSSPSRVFGMVGFMRLAVNKYDALLRSLVERGPVAASMAATGWSRYARGLYDCKSSWVVDHAVSLIGYGIDAQTSKPFYQIQNSWGPGWGENGTMRVLRSEDDEQHCGIDKQPELGTGCEGGPKEVRVCGPCGILYDSVIPLFDRSTLESPERK